MKNRISNIIRKSHTHSRLGEEEGNGKYDKLNTVTLYFFLQRIMPNTLSSSKVIGNGILLILTNR